MEGIRKDFKVQLQSAVRKDRLSSQTGNQDQDSRQMQLPHTGRNEGVGVARPTSNAVRMLATQELLLHLVEMLLEDGIENNPETRATLLALHAACRGSLK